MKIELYDLEFIYQLKLFFYSQIPFAMLSELYPQRTRSMATGVTTAFNNILTFIAIKSFYNFEHWFDLPSTLGIYSVIGMIG